MTTIETILDDVGFYDWNELDQRTSITLMNNLASHTSNNRVIASSSDRVNEAFLQILDMHIARAEQ